MSSADRLPDASEVATMLARRARALCEQLLSVGKAQGGYWKCGSVDNEPGGSLFVHLVGSRAGRWQDAATGEFGDALDLVAACQFRGDKKAAYQWSLAWLGIGSGNPHAPVQQPATKARDAAPDDAVLRRRKAALRLYLEAQASIAGTPVAAYLLNRGIDLSQLGRQPRALRFHPGLRHNPSGLTFPAMVAAISSMDGAHIATHRTWLQQDRHGRWIKARVEDPKMTLGDFAGGSIRLWRGASCKSLREAPAEDVVVIGEGIETCLSIALACPEFRVIAAVSLGNMASIQMPPQVCHVILAADNDVNLKAAAAFQRAVARHLDAGRDVRVARPMVGKDFNDTLQAWGRAA